jgi:hypothetical protein
METYCLSQPDPIEPWQTGSFDGWESSDDSWTFYGQFVGEGMEGATVTFGGVLGGYTAQLDANGNFWVSAQLGCIDGYASAEVVDPTGQTLTMEVYCVSEPETLEPWQSGGFAIDGVSDGYWTFSGNFIGEGTEGATVTFGGVLSGYTAQLDANGGFCVSAQLGNVEGWASAEVVDPTGQTLSMETYCYSEPEPEPLAISFGGSCQSEYDGIWYFTGAVSGTNAAGASISFGGVLGGMTAQADSAGQFSFSVQMTGVSGMATAIAFAGGTESNMAECYVG